MKADHDHADRLARPPESLGSKRTPPLWATGVVFVCFVLSFLFYVMAKAAQEQAHLRHDRVANVVNELRLASDQLTRMARSYVATGLPAYREYFYALRDIHDGKKPPPVKNGIAYWDALLAGDHLETRTSTTARGLQSLKRGFTAEERKLLGRLGQSERLLRELEMRAMDRHDAKGGDQAENRRNATRMLHDQRFLRAKADVLLQIEELYRRASARTASDIDFADKVALALQLVFLSLGAALVVMLFRARRKLLEVLGGQVDDVYEHIAALGKGELSATIPVPAGRGDSVLGWLEQARQQLLASEERRWQAVANLNDAQRLANIGSWELDLPRNQLLWSDEIYRIFEIDPGEFEASYEGFLAIVHPEDRVRVDEAYQRSLQTRQPYSITHRLQMRNGRIKYVHEHAETRFDRDGAPLLSFGTVQDVTEKHVLQEVLAALATTLAPLSGEGLYRAVTLLLQELLGLDQVFLARVDDAGAQCRVIVGWNAGLPMGAMSYPLAHTPCATVIRDGHEFYATDVQAAFPADSMLSQWGTVGYVGSAISDSQRTRSILVGLSCHTIDHVELVEQVFSLMVDRLRAEMLRADAELELSSSEARIRGLGDNLPNGFIYQLIKDNEDAPRFVYVSSGITRIIGITPEEALSDSSALYAQIDRSMITEFMVREAESRRNLQDFEAEFRIVDRTGRQRWISARSRPRVDVDGQVLWDGVALDITEQRLAEDRLKLTASVFEYANEGIMITDPFGTILDVNDAFSAITGYEKTVAVGQNARMLRSGRHDHAFYADMWGQLKDHGHWRGEIWNRRQDGGFYAELLTIGSVRGKNHEITHFVALFHDITALKNHQKELEFIAHYDALTRLPNRVLLADRLQQAMTQARRHHNRIAVAYIDLDGFKGVNDRFSHAVGDKLLVQVAAKLRQSLRDGDTLSRLGGDEFVAVLLDLDAPDDALPVLARLLEATSMTHACDGLELGVSASIGVCFYPQEDDLVDADQLLRQADQAMYLAKQAGKNRYHVFDAEHDRSVRSHHEGIEQIRHALRHQEFVLFYQPKVNMRTGVVVGVEALIRWQHPERGLLPPAAFLPLIDNHSMSIEVGEWVLETALCQVGEWREIGLVLPISVNIDAIQLSQRNFIDKLKSQLARHTRYHPGDLELEVLETSALDDMAHISGVMAACRELGVGFALDDFGTGYSSLTYLKRLPAQVLKIDQSFVRDMLDDPDDVAILDGVLGLALAFQRQAIAEGVETFAHSEMLLRMGCELAQGYAIARPMPAAAIPGWVKAWRPDAGWQHLRRIEREDLPVLAAMAEYRACVNLLKLQLEGVSSLATMPSALSSRLGQWLDAPQGRRYLEQPSLERIVTLHQSFFGLLADALQQDSRGFRTDAQARLGEIESARDELLGLLQKLISTDQNVADSLSA